MHKELIKETRLENGLTVITYKCQAPSVATIIGVNVGSIDEPEEIAGATHYLEHMLFKGTKTYGSKEVRRILRKLGYFNAFTDYEYTSYVTDVPTFNFEKSLDILSEMIQYPRFDEREFEKERNVILNECYEAKDDPGEFALENFPQCIFTVHPARRPIVGFEESIQRITREDLIKLYEAHYTPENVAVIIAGDVDYEKIVKKVGERFAQFDRKGKAKNRFLAREKRARRELTLQRQGINLTRLLIGFDVGEYSEQKEWPLHVLTEYLDERIEDRIREKSGGAYASGCAVHTFSTFGILVAYASIGKPLTLPKATSVILKEYEHVEEGKISKMSVELSKESLINRYTESNPVTIASLILDFFFTTKDPSLYLSYPEKIRKVKMEDVRNVGKKAIDTLNYGMLVLKPMK